MKPEKNQIFDELRQSLEEAVAIVRGELLPARVTAMLAPDVQAIRRKTGLSQAAFARLLRITMSKRCRTGNRGVDSQRALPRHC